MTDPSDIVAKAREALDGITPGPWAWYRYGTQFEVFTESVSIAPDDVADVADNLRHLADAEFVAAAPDLVRDLLAALETAETERADLAETLMHVEDSKALFTGLFDEAAAERNAARDTIVAVERALSNHPECDKYSPDDVVSCGWKRAVVDVRAALGGVS